MGYFNRLKPPFMVSALGETAALAALADADHIAKSVRSNATEAERLTRELSQLGISVVPTWANFLFCEIGDECASMCQQIQDAEHHRATHDRKLERAPCVSRDSGHT